MEFYNMADLNEAIKQFEKELRENLRRVLNMPKQQNTNTKETIIGVINDEAKELFTLYKQSVKDLIRKIRNDMIPQFEKALLETVQSEIHKPLHKSKTAFKNEENKRLIEAFTEGFEMKYAKEIEEMQYKLADHYFMIYRAFGYDMQANLFICPDTGVVSEITELIKN
jgi:hypothetical protein